jgi:transposase
VRTFTADKIIQALRAHKRGIKAATICRNLKIGLSTFYLWQKRYADVGVKELRQGSGGATPQKVESIPEGPFQTRLIQARRRPLWIFKS